MSVRSSGRRARGVTIRCRLRGRIPAVTSAAGSASAVSEVRLEAWERAWAGHVGLMRDKANAEKGDAAYYDPARMEDNVRASIAAACAEMAVAKRLNKYWDGSFWEASQHRRFAGRPDVGENTEVRRVRRRNSPLPVRLRDVERQRIMVLAFPIPDDFMVVDVIGWGKAVDLWEQGADADYDRAGTTRLVSQDRLYPL